MSKTTIYQAACYFCQEEFESEIEGDVDEFLREHEDEENHDYKG